MKLQHYRCAGCSRIVTANRILLVILMQSDGQDRWFYTCQLGSFKLAQMTKVMLFRMQNSHVQWIFRTVVFRQYRLEQCPVMFTHKIIYVYTCHVTWCLNTISSLDFEAVQYDMTLMMTGSKPPSHFTSVQYTEAILMLLLICISLNCM